MEGTPVEQVIQSVKDYYDQHGIFLKRFGFGKKPGLVIIDMAYGWTDPEYATGSQRLDEAVIEIRRLLEVFRERSLPVVYTTSPFRQEDVAPFQATKESEKMFRPWDVHACEIDSRLAPRNDEFVIYKDNASAFFGTHLAAHLIDKGVDTLVVTGCSTSACVRATVTDARAYRFKAIIPRECVQDRAAAAHEWNLFDMDAKFGDVVATDEVLAFLKELDTEEKQD